jgi:hypothetical protein
LLLDISLNYFAVFLGSPVCSHGYRVAQTGS